MNKPNYESQVNNLPCIEPITEITIYKDGYTWGHRDARHAAAELAAKADATIALLESQNKELKKRLAELMRG